MKRTLKSLLALTALASAVNVSAAVTHFSIRSQSVNVAREMVGWQNLINLCDMDEINGAFSITPEYTQTFRSSCIARCLFGDDICVSGGDCGASIKVSGSNVSNRGANDWLADYFGLPTDFQSTLTFRPRIRNILVDLNLFLGLDEWASGLYFKIHAPVVNTRWDLRFCENVITQGTGAWPAGYFQGSVDPVANLLQNATSFLTGSAAPTFASGDCITSAATGGSALVFDKLTCAKFSSNGCDCRELSKTRLSDIEFALGWNFWCDEDYLVGLSIRASAPTGNKPCGRFLFEPIVGSGGHWKLGGGLNAQAIFWRSEDEDRSFGVYLDAHVQHLFNACQTRCFDLLCKPNSRYMTAIRLGSTRECNHLTGTADDAGVEFQNEFAPVANLTMSPVSVSVAVEGDVALKFAFMHRNWEFDLGYNFWGRSCEKICRKSPCTPDPLDGATWALKGDAMVVGFSPDSYCGCNEIRLAPSESAATIHGGTSSVGTVTTGLVVPNTNPNIDNAQLAFGTDGLPVFALPQATGPQTHSSKAVVYLSEASVDFSGTRAISHKIFGNASYSWNENDDWTPFLGIGGEVEFNGDGGCSACSSSSCDSSCNTSCNTGCVTSATSTTSTTSTASTKGCCSTGCSSSSSCGTSCSTGCSSGCSSSCSDSCCQRCAINQWGVWVKGGIAFN